LVERNILLEDRRRNRSKEEKEIINSLKIFVRFTSQPEHYERLLGMFFKER